MNAKEYLLQIRKIDRLIENKIAEAEHWRNVATGTTAFSDGDRVQSSGSKQKMADAVCRYVTMEEEITKDIDRLIDVRQEVIRTIEQLPDVEYNLLHKVYVQYKEFNEIAAALDKSYSWVTTIHGRALTSLQRLLDEKEGEKDD